MNQYYTYILTNYYNNVLYVGVTNDLERRLFEHKNRLIKGFTSKYNLYRLVYLEEFSQIEDAISAEKRIKGWTRAKKNQLVESKNPAWEDLGQEILRFAQDDNL